MILESLSNFLDQSSHGDDGVCQNNLWLLQLKVFDTWLFQVDGEGNNPGYFLDLVLSIVCWVEDELTRDQLYKVQVVEQVLSVAKFTPSNEIICILQFIW